MCCAVVMTYDLFRSEHQLQLTKLVEQLLLHVQKFRRTVELCALRVYDEPVPYLDDALFQLLARFRHTCAAGGWYLIQINCPFLSKHVS